MRHKEDLRPEVFRRSSVIQVLVIISLLASIVYAYGAYWTITVFACWNRCSHLYEEPFGLAFFTPFIVGPFAANAVYIWLRKKSGKAYGWLLLGPVFGTVATFWYGAYLFQSSRHDLFSPENAHLFYFLAVGFAMVLPFLVFLANRPRG